MTIYNINFGIGWASSGVEYAQLYRAQALRKQEEGLKFVFLDFIGNENIQTLTENLGFYDDEVIWLYQYFTDIKVAPSSVKVRDVLQTINGNIEKTEQTERIRKVFFDDGKYIVCYLKDEMKEVVDRVEYIANGKLLRRDYFSYVRILSEYFAPEDGKAKLYMRVFYNEDGSNAYMEYVNGNDSMFKVDNHVFYSKQAFVGYFMEQLNLSEQDIILLDRSKDVAQTILQRKHPAKLGIVIHAEHYNEPTTDDNYILWNNHYEYVFTNAHEFDFFITATARQRELLQDQFRKYLQIEPKIYTIPVGNLSALKCAKYRNPYSLITASRLANEKHVDWLVKAVILAKKEIPQLTFDIYGEGTQKKLLKKIIADNHATDYIQLHGHKNLDDVYQQYELFLSGSTSEGFGLTLMEAVGSGLGMIGFDVNYGNPTFIEDQKNGYLIPISLNKDAKNDITKKIATAIINYFKNDINVDHEVSYKIAESFTLPVVEEKWKVLIEEVRND
ncbi:accessory Sec system glycosyltransferase GtfA [Mammaliicoccus sciuri]|uniref:UDP-N-acetylglucosamine--peptide N-acetylglucosaminyltransferase GtfA subunit n=1 Tax=Mammaliicoccus sciuri TaxID=1296 RepID=A0AB37HKJ6_MAMSC|nr:accessory Sec system glycosyltransferase GtfA [Mammaliicoccus sciuri]QRN91316.1 accessory Sec system glycosyltransferase GtfA [Mammaliicoccus sciuri]